MDRHDQRVARFVGGPLDGQTTQRSSGSRWSAYRDARGAKLGTGLGDSNRFGRARKPIGIYAFEKQRGEPTYRWHPPRDKS